MSVFFQWQITFTFFPLSLFFSFIALSVWGVGGGVRAMATSALFVRDLHTRKLILPISTVCYFSHQASNRAVALVHAKITLQMPSHTIYSESMML